MYLALYNYSLCLMCARSQFRVLCRPYLYGSGDRVLLRIRYHSICLIRVSYQVSFKFLFQCFFLLFSGTVALEISVYNVKCLFKILYLVTMNCKALRA